MENKKQDRKKDKNDIFFQEKDGDNAIIRKISNNKLIYRALNQLLCIFLSLGRRQYSA